MSNNSKLKRDDLKATTSPVLGGIAPLTMTVATFRAVSGLGNTKTWELIKTGELETVRVGGRTLITHRSVEKLLLPSPESKDEALHRRHRRPRKVRS
ncbi:MAG: hypothetical protein WBW73_01745 [Rhodoplanes sp.]